MTEQAASYRKTVLAVGVVSASALAIAIWVPIRSLGKPTVAGWLGWAILFLSALFTSGLGGLITAGGLIAMRRDRWEEAGRPYATTARRESLVSPLLGWLLRTFRRNDHGDGNPRPRLGLRPGEWVQIRHMDEILGTLDANGMLEGVPFMPEMAAFCGQHVRVFRRVDKLNDWIHVAGLKRTRNLVLLDGLRCGGSAHGGCQTFCHLRWREAWLRRSRPAGSAAQRSSAACTATGTLGAHCVRNDGAGGSRYVCQATELTTGAPPIRASDLRHLLRDLYYGNVRLARFLTGIAIGAFNWAQGARGGSRFPSYVPSGPTRLPPEDLRLMAGERVRVKSKHAIEPTLNAKSRNRGLYFDRDMLRYCGGEFTVRARLERVIVERTGKLLELPTACITLDGVTATGEYSGFNPENEFIFWREAWLERSGGRSAYQGHGATSGIPDAPERPIV